MHSIISIICVIGVATLILVWLFGIINSMSISMSLRVLILLCMGVWSQFTLLQAF